MPVPGWLLGWGRGGGATHPPSGEWDKGNRTQVIGFQLSLLLDELPKCLYAPSRPNWDNQPASLSQLSRQRARHVIRSGGHDDRIEEDIFRPAIITIPLFHM